MRREATFPNATASVPLARQFVADQLDGLRPDTIEEALLMVSELASNAICHAHSPFTVTVERLSTQVRVAVTDSGDGEPHICSPSPQAHSGRGLLIINALAAGWGVDRLSGTSKSVWFQIAAPSRGGIPALI